MQNPYKKALQESLASFKNSILGQISSDNFDWHFFSKLLIEEGSPLQGIFDIKAVRLAEMVDKSKSLELAASEFFKEDSSPETDVEAADISAETTSHALAASPMSERRKAWLQKAFADYVSDAPEKVWDASEDADITISQIKALRAEAQAAGDSIMTEFCDLALAPHETTDDEGRQLINPVSGESITRTSARAVCAGAIAMAQSQKDD